VGRSEKLIEFGDSWLSPKCIEVQLHLFSIGGRALNGLGGSPPTPIKLRMPILKKMEVRLWEISSMVERETAQTVS
jgi:hypothetical protein